MEQDFVVGTDAFVECTPPKGEGFDGQIATLGIFVISKESQDIAEFTGTKLVECSPSSQAKHSQAYGMMIRRNVSILCTIVARLFGYLEQDNARSHSTYTITPCHQCSNASNFSYMKYAQIRNMKP